MSVQSIVIPTPRSVLRQHRGAPIPWVVRWSGEVSTDAAQVSLDTATGAVHLTYQDGNEDRDNYGMLWKREGLGRQGEPEFAQLNTYRQRASMNKRLCQVCGSKINERPIRWLVGAGQLHHTNEGTFTISPPTCSSCIPLALELCPHLNSKGYTILRVLDYRRWGVYGEGVTLDQETKKGRQLRGIYVPYENPPLELSAVVAFQQVALLTKFVVEEEVEGDGEV